MITVRQHDTIKRNALPDLAYGSFDRLAAHVLSSSPRGAIECASFTWSATFWPRRIGFCWLQVVCRGLAPLHSHRSGWDSWTRSWYGERFVCGMGWYLQGNNLLRSIEICEPLRSCDKNCRKLNGCFVLEKRCFKIKSSKERLFPVCCEMGSWPARNDSKTHFMETSISSDKSTSSQDLLCLLLKRSLEKNPNLSHSKSCFHFRWICSQCCR